MSSIKELLAKRLAGEGVATTRATKAVEKLATAVKPAVTAKASSGKAKLDAIRERLAARQAAREKEVSLLSSLEERKKALAGVSEAIEAAPLLKREVILNENQQKAVSMALSGKSFCLIGAAGTGKSTAQKEVARVLVRTGMLGTHKFRVAGRRGEPVEAPSIAFIAFTRVACANLRRIIHADEELAEMLPVNVCSYHNLLEYAPAKVEVELADGTTTSVMRFKPRRDEFAPLDITHLIIEESSQISLGMWDTLLKALRPDVQIILIGDINQLPPIHGDSILIKALTQLEVIELTEVYRQALESPVLANAHNILKGLPLDYSKKEFTLWQDRERLPPIRMGIKISKTIAHLINTGKLDGDDFVVLSPVNKEGIGIETLNNRIAGHLAEFRGVETYEIFAGANRLFLAVGDTVLVDKAKAVVTAIEYNHSRYRGIKPREPVLNMNRFFDDSLHEDTDMDDLLDSLDRKYSSLDVESILKAQEAQLEDDEEAKKQRAASHIVTVRILDNMGDEGYSATKQLTTSGDFAPDNFQLSYALTTHRAQGCEWGTVFVLLPYDTVRLSIVNREWLYTAVTRASKQCVLVSEEAIITRFIGRQRYTGASTKEKIKEYAALNDGRAVFIPNREAYGAMG